MLLRPLSRIATAALVAGVLAACNSGGGPTKPSTVKPEHPTTKGRLVVGAYDLGESQVLAHMYADVLAKAGYTVTVQTVTNREAAVTALEGGKAQVVPDYAGTLTEYFNRKDNGPHAQPRASGDLTATVKALKQLAARHGLHVLAPAKAADENAFAVTKAYAAKHSLATLSDLKGVQGGLVVGGPAGCVSSPSCLRGLRTVYKVHVTKFVPLDPGGPATKKALEQGTVQLGLVFTSDGQLTDYKLVILADDKHLETVDNVIPVVTSDLVGKTDAVRALDRVQAVLTTEDLRSLNRLVDVEGKDPATAARDYLKKKKLL